MKLETLLKLILVAGVLFWAYRNGTLQTWEALITIILVLIWVELVELNAKKDD
jgi:hypothetical protein